MPQLPATTRPKALITIKNLRLADTMGQMRLSGYMSISALDTPGDYNSSNIPRAPDACPSQHATRPLRSPHPLAPVSYITRTAIMNKKE